MSLEFDKIAHIYTVDGVVTPSVTQIIQEFIPFKAAGAGVEIAAHFGSVVHATVELFERGTLADCDPAVKPWLAGWQLFRSDYPALVDLVEPRILETRLYTKRYGYAGTIDRAFYATDRGKVILVDIKTGCPSRTWDLQTAAYDNLLRENLLDRKMTRIDRWCVQLLEGGYKLYKPRLSTTMDFNRFLSLLNVHKIKKEFNV